MKYGLLIEYDYCVGCYACINACNQELGLPAKQTGMHLVEIGPETLNAPKIYFFPFPTDECNLCFPRVKKGLKPACTTVCPSGAIKFGTLEELIKYAEKGSKYVIWAPR